MSAATLKREMTDLGGQLLERRNRLAGYLGEKENGAVKADQTRLEEIRSVNDEINDLQPKYDAKKSLWQQAVDNEAAIADLKSIQYPAGFHAAAGHDGAGTSMQGEVKALGDLFVAGEGYKSFQADRQQGKGGSIRFQDELAGANLKTLFQRSAGWSPFSTRQPGYVAFSQQQPKLLDLVPMYNTDQSSIRFMQHTINTNAAAMLAEGGTLPESAYGLAEVIQPVQKLGHFIPVTEEQLADVAGVRDFLNTQLELGCKQVVDKQIGSTAGDGTGSNLLGFYNAAGLLNQNQGGDAVHDAIFKAMVKVQTTGFADSDAIWMTPLNWQDVRLTKTSQGVYLWGNPDQVGPQRMWGLPVATSTYLPANKPLVGAFQQYSALWVRSGVAVEVSNSHADFFIKNQLAIRAVMRLCLTIMKGPAFCTVGLGVA